MVESRGTILRQNNSNSKDTNYYEPLKQVARRRVRSVLKIHINNKTPVKSTSPSPSFLNGGNQAFMIPTMKTEYENYST